MHYLVDIDNTLLDTYYYDENGTAHFYWSQNILCDLGIYPHDLKELFTPKFQKALQETINLDDFILDFLKSKKLKLTPQDFKEYWMEKDANLNQKVYEWLEKQKEKGHTLHIASNQPHIRMDFLWNKFTSWHSLFDYVFTSSKLGVAKPDQKFFYLAQQKINVPFNEICLIDDSPENIKAAQLLGMKTILFENQLDLK